MKKNKDIGLFDNWLAFVVPDFLAEAADEVLLC